MYGLLNRNSASARFIACVALIAFSAGCTTMQPVQAGGAAAFAARIEAGDNVRILRNNLSTAEFEVSTVTDDGIGGEGIFIPWSDVQQVEIRKISAWRTVAVIMLSALVIAVAASWGDPVLEGFSLAAPPP